ncbi:MAG: FmdB family zinc ribbon protein, partial [Planctomyces sp.]
MPLFEFVCEQCQHQAELLVGRSETPACPSCGSRKMQKQLSV